MIAVLQRVTRASVAVDGQVVGQISRGLVALVAVERGDAQRHAQWMAGKLAALRMFPGETGKALDRDVREIGGAILLVSNFTVAADSGRGRRPSLENAAPPAEAEPVFEVLAGLLREQGVQVETGRFRAMMQVELVNEGPVTFIVQTPR